jgi:uncharacterized protein YbjQ (UPF0145 family)
MGGNDPENAEDAERREADSLDALARGGLPATARRRIKEAEKSGGTWSSDLAVAELAALRAVGFDPVGLVMGSSVYQIAYQYGATYGQSVTGGRGTYVERYPCQHPYAHEGMRSGYNWEHTIFESGITTARNLAMGRLVAEAQALGAHGVVGMRIRFERQRGGASQVGQLEFTAIGTAVRRAGAPALPWPFTCHLSGQEFAKLLRVGIVPAAYVMGVAAVEVDAGCTLEYQERSSVNQELAQPTAAIQRCREIAVAHLEHEAEQVGEGVIGVELHIAQHRLGLGAEIFELQASGTAVRRFADGPLPAEPLAIMRLGGTK